MKSFRTVLVILAISIIAGFLLFSERGSLKQTPGFLTGKAAILASPIPSPFLFQELTIPYLRSRQYKSELGELKQYSDNGSFTSYLTSYTSDGLKINGLLTKPNGEMPPGGFPAIVFIHGYISPSLYATTERYVDYVNFLARDGFVVFKIDLRGHGNSEGDPGGAYYSSDYIIDTLNAYSALQNSGFVNPRKIGLWGHSMAGNITLRALAVKPDIPAASIWAGAGYTYTDLNEFGIQDNSYHPPGDNPDRQRKRKLLIDTYGNPKDGNPFWKLVAATNYLNDFKGAIQLNHAVDDATVNIGYSRNLNRLLDATRIPHQFNEFPSGGHNITGPSFTAAMQKTVEFFKKYLN